MRTEDDLRAVLRALESHAPNADDVLREVYDSSPALSRARRLQVLRLFHVRPFGHRRGNGSG
jgi:hypothetical protein